MADMTIFAKISAKLYLNVKVQALASANPRAFVTWINAISYAVDMRTDGFLEAFALKRFLGARTRDIAALVDAGLLEDKGDDTYYIHDFDESQNTTEKISELKAKRAEAGRKGMKARYNKQEKPEAETHPQEPAEAAESAPDQQPNTRVSRNQIRKPVEIIPIPANTPDQEYKQALHDKENLIQSTLDRIAKFYPPNSFDGYKTQTRFDLENNYAKIVEASTQAGYTNPFDFLVDRAKAYTRSNEPRYIKKFSRFLAQEDYTTDWKPREREKTQAEINQENANRMIEEMDRQAGWII